MRKNAPGKNALTAPPETLVRRSGLKIITISVIIAIRMMIARIGEARRSRSGAKTGRRRSEIRRRNSWIRTRFSASKIKNPDLKRIFGKKAVEQMVKKDKLRRGSSENWENDKLTRGQNSLPVPCFKFSKKL